MLTIIDKAAFLSVHTIEDAGLRYGQITFSNGIQSQPFFSKEIGLLLSTHAFMAGILDPYEKLELDRQIQESDFPDEEQPHDRIIEELLETEMDEDDTELLHASDGTKPTPGKIRLH